jgi:hypothetical protein
MGEIEANVNQLILHTVCYRVFIRTERRPRRNLSSASTRASLEAGVLIAESGKYNGCYLLA